MGYSHGTKWNDELIQKRIEIVMDKVGITTMPTQSMTTEVFGNTSLNDAISRSGGFIFWANKLGLEHMGIETVLGRDFETHCMMFIQDKFDVNVEEMPPRYPYDLLVGNNIKVDVKVSKMYNNTIKMYTFNLEKRFPTCDIFVAYCIDDNKNIVKTYVIPSAILSGITQLSVGIDKSKYDIYLDKWDIVDKYAKFYASF